MPHRPAACTALALLALAPPAFAAITGVCPDGSIFIVQDATAIPCSAAKRVEPSDVPPIAPQLLPRPYGWERFNQRSDPNNPYNVVDSPSVAAPPPDAAPPAPGLAPPAPSAGATPAIAAPAPATAPARTLDLALSQRDVADLDEIVALQQSVAPATLATHADDGARSLLVQLALSSAFEQRMHTALARQGGGQRGPVLLFRAEAGAAEPFYGNLTFVQGHIAFHPDPANPDQFGVIAGRLGDLVAGERVLGYTVLPEHLDPAKPLDIYWNDRRVTATLRP